MFMLTTVSYLLWHKQTLQFHTYSTSNKLCRYQNTSLLSRSLGGCRKVWLRCRYVREHVCLSCSGTATRVAAGGLKLLYHFKIYWNLKNRSSVWSPAFPDARPSHAYGALRFLLCIRHVYAAVFSASLPGRRLAVSPDQWEGASRIHWRVCVSACTRQAIERLSAVYQTKTRVSHGSGGGRGPFTATWFIVVGII